MTQHHDILDEREASLRSPFIGSMALHAAIAVSLTGFTLWSQHNAAQWGSPNPMGGAIGVSAVEKIPLPNRSVTPNPVANDTTSSVPQKPEKTEKRKVVKEDEDAIPLNSRKLKKPKRWSEEVAEMQKYRPVPERPNQVYSTTGAGVNSPMYGQRGIGGIGIGDSTIAGRGCGGYLELVRQRIQTRWDTQSISAGLRTGVSLSLILQRSGTVSGVSIVQTSGSSEVDFAAKRAISDASPFPPFLPTCEGNEAKIEVRFEPKR